jgi:hypothetical protein
MGGSKWLKGRQFADEVIFWEIRDFVDQVI